MESGWAVLKDKPLLQRAEEFLTQYVLSGEVAPGEYLPSEQVLCERLGIGRSTLREALSIMEAKGLVERRHGVGVRVTDRSYQAAASMLDLMLRRNRASQQDLLEMRRLFEGQAAAWAAERATQERVEAIRDALETMRSTQTDLREYARADLNFHLAVAKATSNSVLILMVETIRVLLLDVIVTSLRADYRPEVTLRFHEQVLQAVSEHDPVKAARAMAAHLEDADAMIRRAEADEGETSATDASTNAVSDEAKGPPVGPER